ncbi:MAG: GWxTD domain-containing protein [Cyclobacteriaceae bacterium]
MWINKIIVYCLFVLVAVSANAIDFSRVNISWQYDPLSEIELRNRVLQKGDSMMVFIRFRFDATAKWEMDYLVQSGYESEAHRNLAPYSIDTLMSADGSAIVKLTFKKPKEDLLIAKIFKEDAFYYYDIPLQNGSLPYSSIQLVDEGGIPIFDNYLNTSNFTWTGSEEFYVMQYSEKFGPADPPMGEMKPLAPSIFPDTTFRFSTSVTFVDNNFYVVREDSNALSGVIVFKASPYYPEFKLLGELAASMHYILNEPEQKAIRNSTNLKDSFDSFWVKTYTTKFRARNAIRNYFNWIKQANKRFTDFKPGWKTDRGMIYVVYGVPDEVYRLDGEEEWYYDEGPSFEYSVISTFFSPRTYSLRRSQEHEKSWFEFIAAMRRGTND